MQGIPVEDVLVTAFNVAAAADNTLIAAPTSGRIRVISIIFTNTGANTLTFKSGAVGISGPMDYGALASVALTSGGGTAIFSCTPTTALVLNLSAATKVAGLISYVVV